MNKLKIFLFNFATIVEAALVDHIQTCELVDTECQRSTFNVILHYISENGAPEYGIPVMDPFRITDSQIVYYDIMNFTLTDGLMYGLKDCDFQSFVMNNNEREGKLDAMCNLSLKGFYKSKSVGPLIHIIFGEGNLIGDGQIKIVIDKLQISFDLKRLIKKRGNDFYLKYDMTYTYDVLDKITFKVSNISHDNEDISQHVNKIINECWRAVMELFGKPFVDKAVDYYRLYTNRIHESIPASKFIGGNLTRYFKSKYSYL